MHRIVTLEAAFDVQARRLFAVEAQSVLCFPGAPDVLDQFGELCKLASAAHNIYVRSAAENEFLVLLGHAAEDAENLFGMLFHVAAQPTEGAIDFVLGVLADAACVEENHVGVGRFIRQLVAEAAQTADD